MMEAIYVFLIRNDVWIYILCGLGFIWYFAQLVRSRSMLRRSMFGLEIERGRRIFRRSLLLVLLTVVVAGAVTYVNLSIAPTLPPELLKPPTPTPNIFATPLSSPTPPPGQATPTIFLAPTVTLASSGSANPAATSLPGEPSPAQPGSGESGAPVEASPEPSRAAAACAPGINITAPPGGALLSATVTFFGSASAQAFAYYTFEVNGPRTEGQWTALPLASPTQQVFDNILTSIDVSGWQSGSHAFRLSVFDVDDDLLGQCEIQLLVESGNS